MKTDLAFVICFMSAQCFLLLGTDGQTTRLEATVSPKNTTNVATKPAADTVANIISTAKGKILTREFREYDEMPPLPVNVSDWCRLFRYADASIVKILKENWTNLSGELLEAIRAHHKLITGIFYMSVTRGHKQMADAYFNATMHAGGLRFVRVPVDRVSNFFSYNKTLQREASKKFSKSQIMWYELMKNFNRPTSTFVAPRFI